MVCWHVIQLIDRSRKNVFPFCFGKYKYKHIIKFKLLNSKSVLFRDGWRRMRDVIISTYPPTLLQQI